jgi:hypothetical protein
MRLETGNLKTVLLLAALALIGTPAEGLAATSAPAKSTTKTATTKVPAPVKKPAPLPVRPAKTRSVEISIPYPNAAMYLYRGIYGSFAGGGFYAQDSIGTSWNDALFQWQGEVSYFYTDWFSAGFGFKINAGETSNGQVVQNRYFLLGRFHKAWPKAAVFAGVNLGVDDVSVSLNSQDSSLPISAPLKETNAAIGLEAGGGWKFSHYVGATLGQRVDVSLVKQRESDRRAITFHTQPGLALDLLRVAPSLRESVKGLYLLSEVQLGWLLLANGESRQDLAWITGLSLAF